MTTGPYGDSPAAADPYSSPPQGYPSPNYQAAQQPPPGFSTYPPVAYPAPGYGTTPVGYGAYAPPRNGLGTAALVLGIIGVVFCWIPFTGWVLNILAITFGAIGRKRASVGVANNKSSAVAGLVLGVIGLGVWVIILVVLMSAASSVGVLL